MTESKLVRGSDLQSLGIRVSEEGGGVRYLEGARHGLSTSIYEGEVAPGSGPGAHTHPYVEFAVVCAGRASFVVGGKTFEAESGDVVIIPAGELHDFSNPGDTMLKLIAIHEAPVHAGSHLS
jgi:quercetin dioxygenase-like cupin family protein